jgi:hypothetical protein
LIVIPEEAEHLLPLVPEAKSSPTYLLRYAAPVTRKMLHFNNLKYFSVPALPKDCEAPLWLRVELGIFAGRLYFAYSEYSCLLQYLGMKVYANLEGEGTGALGTQNDGVHDTIKEAPKRQKPEGSKGISRKPLSFLQEWLAICRKGQDFVHTPMGFVCQGKPLLESHPFFARSGNDTDEKRPVQIRRFGAVSKNEDKEEEIEQDFCDDLYGLDIGLDEKDTFDDRQLNDDKWKTVR